MAAASELDGLFRLPLDEFTAARNALAAKLKKAGHPEEADSVRSVAKPGVAAWAVNQLYWGHRKAFDQLIAAGDRFRTAQAAQLAGKATDLRAPLETRRKALTELSKLAAAILRRAGHNPAPDMMRRINTTLEALATYGSHPGAPAPGRLTDDVDPPGFEALAALIPRGGRGGKGSGDHANRIIPFRQAPQPRTTKKRATAEELEQEHEEERKRALSQAKSALQEAERTLKDARKAAEQAEAALKQAAARAKEAEKEKADLEKRFERASADADQARQEARRVASQAEDAAQEVDEAERALEKARRELESLSE